MIVWLLARQWQIRRVARAVRGGVQGLRWDQQQWWWQPAGASLAGSDAAAKGVASAVEVPVQMPVQVQVQVLLDLERWMLLRLVPSGSGWRFWRHRLLPMSRRQQGGHWSLLRIHLFMART
ncbi:hypothetical protein OU995_10015 [Roseateles sp. SL47]|uniref:hypothetical protein n=1 Tax=Roseateles sp. SL47 TaxID=2995138 RepID=UPI002270CDBA|nr:hypothetical protein [Roseateles sp. SL47]WAC75001.1 hypothetical protein OU995_10015 [Roseateles sp. SL47]